MPGRDFLAVLRCLEPNQLGDMLAGVFAPLAFMGVLISIVYQRRDLAMQRDEMELTRREMEASTAALNAQAEEAKRTAEFMRVQTVGIETERQHAELNNARYGFITWLQTLMEHKELAGWSSAEIERAGPERFFEHLYRTLAESNRMLIGVHAWSKADLIKIADEIERLAELAAKIEDQRTLVFNADRYATLMRLVRARADKLNR